MPAWDILLRLASAPGWREAPYGGGGGPVAGNPMGTSTLPTSSAWNCSTFQAKAALWGGYYLGRQGFRFSVSDWSEWMIEELGAAGGVDVAVRLGLARKVVHGIPRGLKPGSWLICQGWASTTSGHAFFLRCCRDAGGLGFAYLEANNGLGLNGIGSRSSSVKNARNWGGTWPAGSLTLEPAAAILDRSETFYSAVLY